MPEFTLSLELEEVFTCEYKVKAESYEEAIAKVQRIEIDNGVGSENTSIFKCDYNRSEFFIDTFGRERKYIEHG